MWVKIAHFILRNRVSILLTITLVTGVFAYYAFTNVKPDMKFANMLPESVPERADHEKLKELFGEDGNILVVGVEGVDIYAPEHFNAWYELGNKLRSIDGVDSVFSVAHLYALKADHEEQKFLLEPVMTQKLGSYAEADSMRRRIESYPFYDQLLYERESGLTLMMVTVNAEKFNSHDRGTIIYDIKDTVGLYKDHFPHVRYSGLPYIREVVAKKIQDELGIFVGLAMSVTALILFLFFRSFKVMIACLFVVAIGVLWSLGTIGMFGFPLTILMSVIPPVIIVIGIPNCIFLLNKYHREYTNHGNKIKALTRVIERIGNATFLTNTTTSLGFATFMFTSSEKLQQFGLVASLNILSLFLISLCVIPIIFSFQRPPSDKHLKHLENRWVNFAVRKLVNAVIYHRRKVYVGTVTLLIAAGIGISMMVTTGNVASDLPQGDPVLEDLEHFEKTMGGVMPFDILIDTKKKGRATRKDNLEKIEKLQRVFEQYRLKDRRIFSKSLSIVDAVKFANQALNDGDSAFYTLDLSGRDRLNLKRYLENSISGDMSNQFLDTTGQITRVSTQVADIGSNEMDQMIPEIAHIADTIINPNREKILELVEEASGAEGDARDSAIAAVYRLNSKVKYDIENMYIGTDTALMMDFAENPDMIYQFHDESGFIDSLEKSVESNTFEITLTGTSVVLTSSTSYMVQNLVISLAIAIFIISVIMSLLFNSWKMVLISLLPNFLPLLVTAGLMGFLGIPIKPSTILVFSIAFGISVDDTIHYLAKYRQEIRHHSWDIKGGALRALKETGVSMIYTSVVLFFGFIIFVFSSFGGTIALGMLVSLTLLVAMVTNLVLLPSLLLSMQKALDSKAFREPYFEIFDEEEDIELDDLEIEELPEEQEPTKRTE